MRLLLSTALVLLSFSVLQAQVVISKNDNNILYIGLSTSLDIAVPGWDNKDLIITVSDDHKLTQQEDGSFIIEPSHKSRQATISVKGVMPDGSLDNLGSKEFKLLHVSSPEVSWGGNRSTITKKEMYSTNPLVVDIGCMDVILDVEFTVVGFALTISYDDAVSPTYVSNNNLLSTDMMKEISQTRAGDRLYFSDIMLVMPDGTRNIGGLNFTVVDN